MKIIDPKICLKCKGRLWCGLDYCPILLKKKALLKIKPFGKEEIDGFEYGVFVGWRGYPRVSLGLFVSERNLPEDYKEYKRFGIKTVAEQRISMVLGKERAHVKEDFGLENEITEIAAAKNKLFVHTEFKGKIRPKIRFFFDYYPIGPTGRIREVEVLDEPKIPRIIEKLYYDEIKAEEAVEILYEKGFPESKIHELFSAGYLGIEKKLVPTRWSITAVDSMLGRRLKERVRNYKSIDEIYFGSYNLYGNEILVFLFPGGYSFEFIEMYKPKAGWNVGKDVTFLRDYEYFNEVKDPNTAGAYFAARLAVLEYLERIKRKARIVVFRIIHPDYIFPLGVWVIREATREAVMRIRKLENTSRFQELLKLSETLKQKELEFYNFS